MTEKISDEELLNELRRITKELGRPPKRDEISKYSKYSSNAYKRAFGGHAKAVLKIGETPTFVRFHTKEDLVNEIKRIYEEIGEVPTYTVFCEKAKFTYQTARNITNNMPWHLLLKECKLFTNEQLSKVLIGNYTTEELKNEALRLKEKYGRCPCYHEMSIEGNIAPIRYAYKYGSYSKAMVALGFDDFLPRGSYQNSTPIKGKDGNFYKSIFEANTAHYLLDLKNNNLIKDYEYERVVFKKDCWRWTCDFVIIFLDGVELYLECDGMESKRKHPYAEGNAKIQYYIDNNFNYAIIEYSRDVYSDLEKILKENNVQI